MNSEGSAAIAVEFFYFEQSQRFLFLKAEKTEKQKLWKSYSFI